MKNNVITIVSNHVGLSDIINHKFGASDVTQTKHYKYKENRIIWSNVKAWSNRTQQVSLKYCNANEENDHGVHAKVILSYDDALCSFILGMENLS
jgi:hypothetical protein